MRGGRPGNLDRWEALAPTVAAEHGVFVAVSQLVGSEGGKLFPGGSLAVGPDGECGWRVDPSSRKAW